MFKKMLIGGLATVTIISGALTVGAQDDTTPVPNNSNAPIVVPFGGRDGEGRLGGRFADRNFDINRGELAALIETYTGLTREELRTAFDGGATLAELIEANGESIDAFIAEAATPVFERIDTAISEGRIDETQAETLKENVTTRLTERLENPIRLGDPDNGRRGGRDGVRQHIDADLVEQYTGMSITETGEAIRNGATLAELIEANGESVDAFIAAAVEQGTARIDEQAATRKANLETAITAIVYGERPTPPTNNR